jgi:uncharacterized lipoprotein YddW (UPF0748 family)
MSRNRCAAAFLTCLGLLSCAKTSSNTTADAVDGPVGEGRPDAAIDTTPFSRVYGVWVAHSSILTEDGINKVVQAAKAAHINTLYPSVIRYGCTYFPSTHLPKCPDSTFDNLGVLVKVARQNGIHVIPWVERIIQSRTGQSPWTASELEVRPGLSNDFPVANVALQSVKERLVGAMIETAKYAVDGIQVDDHLGYVASATGPNATFYKNKLTTFANWMISQYKSQTGKMFELAPHPMPFALNSYLTDWPRWEGIDRIIIQCYRSSADAVIGDNNCQPSYDNFTGIGAVTLANGVQVSNSDIAKIAAKQIARDQSFVLFHAAKLIEIPGLADALAAELPAR